MTRDWVDWLLLGVQALSVIGTLVAVGLAYATIRQAKAQAADAQSALIRERRVDFELGVLKDLAQAAVRINADDARSLAVMLPVRDIPFTAAVLGFPSTPEVEHELGELALPEHTSTRLAQAQAKVVSELQNAIAVRVQARAVLWPE